MIHFYDSASPENVPSGVYAACYVNGYAWDAENVDRMARILRISVERESKWAREARILDIETGAATPADAPGFIMTRHQLYGESVILYVNRSNEPDVREQVANFQKLHPGYPEPLYWVATLDGTMTVEGAWAVQYETSPGDRFDLSILHGANVFHAPAGTAPSVKRYERFGR
jgi:hypothetical protein